MNPFAFLHRERAHRRLRRDHELLLAEHTEAVETLAWFHHAARVQADRAARAECRASEAETVAACLDRQLTEERRKVGALEAIAGPYRDSADEPSPVFDAVTGEHPLPDFGPDGETTAPLRVLPLAAALGRAS